MNLKSICTLLALGIAALADEHTHNTLKHIKDSTTAFHEKMANWDGSYLGALPVVQQSRNLVNTLKVAVAPAAKMRAARSPSNPELESVTMEIARSLADEIGAAVDTAIEMKPKMGAIPYVGERVGKMIFRSLQTAASDLGNEFGPRASEENQQNAQEIVQEIEDHFRRGLEAFE